MQLLNTVGHWSTHFKLLDQQGGFQVVILSSVRLTFSEARMPGSSSTTWSATLSGSTVTNSLSTPSTPICKKQGTMGGSKSALRYRECKSRPQNTAVNQCANRLEASVKSQGVWCWNCGEQTCCKVRLQHLSNDWTGLAAVQSIDPEFPGDQTRKTK